MHRAASSYLPAATALTAAAITAAPLLVNPAVLNVPAAPTFPSVSAPRVQLAAVVSPRDIDDLVERLNSALGSVSSTVTSVVAMPGNSLGSALDSAVAVNNDLWNNMIRATDNRALADLLRALRATSSGGLTRLSDTVADVSGSIVLTTGEVTTLLASTLTGSLSTALHAVAAIINNPLALSSYTGLLNVPLDVAGRVLDDGVDLVNSLGGAVLSTTGALVTGVTSQIDNLLRGVNGALSAAKGLVPGVALLDGVLTAVQGIVTAPVSAALAGVDGLIGALVNAAGRTLGNITHGVGEIAVAWLGDGTGDGALQRSIRAIGTEPLSVASYTQALGAVVAAGVRTVNAVTEIGTGLLSVPFTAGADLSVTAAEMVAKFTGGAATLASGLMRAAGLPSLVANLPHAVAGVVNLAVRAVGKAAAAGFNAVAAVLDPGSLVSRSSAAAAAVAAPQLRQAAESRVVTLDVPVARSVSSEQPQVDVAVADSPPVSMATSSSEVVVDADTAPVGVEPADDASEVAAGVGETVDGDLAGGDPAGQAVEVSVEAGDQEGSTGADPAADAVDAVVAPADEESAGGTTDAGPDTLSENKSDADGPREQLTEAADDDEPTPRGRHASGQTAADSSSTSVGHHRSDRTASDRGKESAGAAGEASSDGRKDTSE